MGRKHTSAETPSDAGGHSAGQRQGVATYTAEWANHTSQLAERQRLAASDRREANWQRWGPYLAERQWGTVREDYSADGEAWTYFPHDHARSRTYRWGEDGLLGWTDRQCRLCFAPALWNGVDPILKERLFGLSAPEGNHGEDVKELYYYLEATPTASYARGLYKYPQCPFPYAELVRENAARSLHDREYEITDTSAFAQQRYFDLEVIYAKATPNDCLIQLNVRNCGPDPATVHLLPQLWFRNTWIWSCTHEGCTLPPRIEQSAPGAWKLCHESLFAWHFLADPANADALPEALFTDNETNSELLYGSPAPTPYTKDAFHRLLVDGDKTAVNPALRGTKAALHYKLELAPGEQRCLRFRLHSSDETPDEPFGTPFSKLLELRQKECDDFYNELIPGHANTEHTTIMRQAWAGMIWSRQFYHYSVNDWLTGDPGLPPPDPARENGRNSNWKHLFNRDILSMPDKWEYPWYAAWDLAFHLVPFTRLDPRFAKQQILLLLREWYMHPNGQIPAYEWTFDDVNPPVHAWAAWRIYKMTAPRGQRDRAFLTEVFHKLLVNFTWWVNRKDPDGRNLFSGGFLGLDNIGPFDRSKPLPGGGQLEQADGTAWMAFYCNTMLAMALELAAEDPAYDGIASKFFEHFVTIADAINTIGADGLWDEDDGFYYDQLRCGNEVQPLRLRSMVGLLPLCAVEVIDAKVIDRLPRFKRRMEWFLRHRKDITREISCLEGSAHIAGRMLLALPNRNKLERILAYLFDENEFLSPYGIRSLSRHHCQNPFEFQLGGSSHVVRYVPGESDSWLFGGNSNWRGPIWFPVNFLILEALQKYHHYYGDSLKVRVPNHHQPVNLEQAALLVAKRMIALFQTTPDGSRPCTADVPLYHNDPWFKNLHQFHEYFHGDDGRGLGANHQTGWTGLIAKILFEVNSRT